MYVACNSWHACSCCRVTTFVRKSFTPCNKADWQFNNVFKTDTMSSVCGSGGFAIVSWMLLCLPENLLGFAVRVVIDVSSLNAHYDCAEISLVFQCNFTWIWLDHRILPAGCRSCQLLEQRPWRPNEQLGVFHTGDRGELALLTPQTSCNSTIFASSAYTEKQETWDRLRTRIHSFPCAATTPELAGWTCRDDNSNNQSAHVLWIDPQWKPNESNHIFIMNFHIRRNFACNQLRFLHTLVFNAFFTWSRNVSSSYAESRCRTNCWCMLSHRGLRSNCEENPESRVLASTNRDAITQCESECSKGTGRPRSGWGWILSLL